MTIRMCEACAAEGVCRLGVVSQSFPTPTSSEGIIRFPLHFSGLPGMAHGGWIAGAFDDAMGRFAWRMADVIHTVSLTIDFVKPAPIEKDLRFTITGERLENGRLRLEAELRVDADRDRLIAKAHGEFVQPRNRPAGV